jgi:hypothetical protein
LEFSRAPGARSPCAAPEEKRKAAGQHKGAFCRVFVVHGQKKVDMGYHLSPLGEVFGPRSTMSALLRTFAMPVLWFSPARRGGVTEHGAARGARVMQALRNMITTPQPSACGGYQGKNGRSITSSVMFSELAASSPSTSTCNKDAARARHDRACTP